MYYYLTAKKDDSLLYFIILLLASIPAVTSYLFWRWLNPATFYERLLTCLAIVFIVYPVTLVIEILFLDLLE